MGNIRSLDQAQEALNRMRRAEKRGTGCHLTAEMIRSLSLTFMGEMWEETDPRKLAEAVRPMTEDGKTHFWVEGKRCPRCGSSLVSNGKEVWCSFVGGREEKACSYGLDGETVLLESV